MVLELGTTRATDPVEAKASLLDLQLIFMVGCYDAIYLWKMKPGWAQRTPDQCWKLLLEPDEVRVVRLQDEPQKQDLHPRSRTCTGGGSAFWNPLLQGRMKSWSLRTQPCLRGDSPSSLIHPGPRGRQRRGTRPLGHSPPPKDGIPAPVGPEGLGRAWLSWEPQPWGSCHVSRCSAQGP